MNDLDLAAIEDLRSVGLTRREHVDLLVAEVRALRAKVERVEALDNGAVMVPLAELRRALRGDES